MIKLLLKATLVSAMLISTANAQISFNETNPTYTVDNSGNFTDKAKSYLGSSFTGQIYTCDTLQSVDQVLKMSSNLESFLYSLSTENCTLTPGKFTLLNAFSLMTANYGSNNIWFGIKVIDQHAVEYFAIAGAPLNK